jgi:hypothetical protein
LSAAMDLVMRDLSSSSEKVAAIFWSSLFSG